MSTPNKEPPKKKPKKIIPQKLDPTDGNDEKTPPLPGFNLAGRPESLKKKEGGLKHNEIKAVVVVVVVVVNVFW